MTLLAPLLQAFFTDRLVRQRRVSEHTVAAYRDTFRLLLRFAAEKSGRAPSELALEDLDARLIGSFLEHLETARSNTVATRNARLAAVRSFYRFAALSEPSNAALIQRVLAIPQKRSARLLVEFLRREEVEALVASPDRTTRIGRRDHALLLIAVQTGLRASELTGLTWADVHLGAGPHVRCLGKGRKQRCTPLTRQTVAVLRAWLAECSGDGPDPVFSGPGGGALSRDALWRLVVRHARDAAQTCPSLRAKRVSPHTLRHTAAMQLLAAGVDRSVIALWLGHEQVETTQIYLHADLALKQQALDRCAPSTTGTGRYRPDDRLLAFLEAL
jgi:site-specific recombinase XerD